MSAEKPSHHLMITSTLFTYDDEVRDGLTTRETIRGTQTQVTLELTNIGSFPFPGGIIETVEIESAEFSFSAFMKAGTKIPALKLGEKTVIEVGNILVTFEGTAWMKIAVSAEDGNPITTYRGVGLAQKNPNVWQRSIYIVNKEMLLTYLTLRRFVEHSKEKRD